LLLDPGTAASLKQANAADRRPVDHLKAVSFMFSASAAVSSMASYTLAKVLSLIGLG
jgi:hypothetical protein